jgi:hypothetical protein
MMQISRKGAAADHGPKSVTLARSKISFDPSDGEFLSKFDDPVSDFTRTGCKHVYRVRHDLSEYLAMTRRLSDSIKEVDDGEVLTALQKAIPHFFRIASVVAAKG